MRGLHRLRFAALRCVRVLRRFLRRFCLVRFRGRYGPLKVGVGHVNVMPHGHRLGVT